MFTGIVESRAVLRAKKKYSGQVRWTFRARGKAVAFREGESVAVDGTCVTATNPHGRTFSADLIPETLRATTLGRLEVGDEVNLERALRLGDRLGGHWVTGHVDGVGRIAEFRRQGRSFRLNIEAPPDIIRRLLHKGSIAIDGISFTLQEIGRRFFVVGVTPHTFRVTTLRSKQPGDPVNLETDLLAKLVQHFHSNKGRSSLKERELRRLGF